MSSGPSVGIAGIRTRPSFIDASIVIQSSGVVPSIMRSRSPRFAPSALRPEARREEASDNSAKLFVSTVLPSTFSAGLAPASPAASSASNQSSAQLKRSGRGQTKAVLASQ